MRGRAERREKRAKFGNEETKEFEKRDLPQLAGMHRVINCESAM
jgi:hypothetical protein